MLTLELGLEQELQGVFLVERTSIAYRNGALDDHHGIGVDTKHKVDDVLDVMSIKEVLDWVIICWRCDDDEICILVCLFTIKSSR